MYHRDDCIALGLSVYPVAAGYFRSNGVVRNLRMIPQHYVISMPIRGEVTERFIWGSTTVKCGDLIVLRPHQWHEVSTSCRFIHTAFLDLEGPGALQLLTSMGGAENAPVIHVRQHRRALAALRQLVDDHHAKEARSPTEFWMRLASIAHWCGSDMWRPPERRQASLVERAEILWHTQQVGVLGPTSLAQGLEVHPNTLLTAVHSERGMTTAQLILQWKVRRARELLAQTDLKLTAIAHASGFASTSHFIRSVRQVTGKRPSALRFEAR
jgi:AraC-like DNA-binding protein